jgi:hypothetical protein
MQRTTEAEGSVLDMVRWEAPCSCCICIFPACKLFISHDRARLGPAAEKEANFYFFFVFFVICFVCPGTRYIHCLLPGARNRHLIPLRLIGWPGSVCHAFDEQATASCEFVVFDHHFRPPPTISPRLISRAAALRKAMSASTPSTIISLIRPAFDKGRASGDLLFFPSEVHIHGDLGIDVGQLQRMTGRVVRE